MNTIRHKLNQYANRKIGTPFVWGVNDCNTCALECLYLINPDFKDILLEVRKSYSSKEEAVAFYKSLDFSWEQGLIDKGYEELEDFSYQPGDVVVIPFGKHLASVHVIFGKLSLSVCMDNGTHLVSTIELLQHKNAKAFKKRS